ncbi:MAG: nucleoside triphosphate pyrophosphohydrolase [Bacteriovoracaceae bacterium]|nr:nucleoside triphosphate pyrophosphohydrolase [Bacteriovoracaceae bacterium]
MPYPELENTIRVIQKLRDPNGGCPWDLAQTHESLLRYLIEESYEYVEAVELNNSEMMCEEIGDVLLQVILHSTIAEQEKRFNIEDVAKRLSTKLVHRHPHVFGEVNEKNLTPEQVRERWEVIKHEEKKAKRSTIPSKLLHNPALRTAYLIGVASQKVAFDWEDHRQVMHKVEEEWQELKDELPPGGHFDKARVADEIGDLLFSVAQLARHLGVEPEEALRNGNKKFLKRYHHVEKLAEAQGRVMGQMTNQEMEDLWIQAKKDLK